MRLRDEDVVGLIVVGAFTLAAAFALWPSRPQRRDETPSVDSDAP